MVNEHIKSVNRIFDIGEDRDGYLRLDRNERSIPYSKKITSKIISSISPDDLVSYPCQKNLYVLMSDFFQVDQSMLLLTPGSDAAIKYIFETFIEKGDEVIMLSPTYAMPEVYSKIFGGCCIKVFFGSKLEMSVDNLLSKKTKKTKIMYLANPNQPTGTVLASKELLRVAQIAEMDNFLLVIDEAYIDFSNESSFLDFIGDFKNVIVLRTFSKAFGLASIRLGCVVAHNAIIKELYKVKPLHDINILAIRGGEYIVQNFHIVKQYLTEIRHSKFFLLKELNKLRIDFVDSNTNFIHIKIPNDTNTEHLASYFKENFILIRSSGIGLPATLDGCIRITIGSKKQMKFFLTILKKYIEEYSA